MKEEIDVEPVECRDTGEIVGTYSEYLETEHWKRFRSKFLRKKRHKICFICGDTPKSIHLHHKTYKRLGNERISDVVALCQLCHEEIHFFFCQKQHQEGLIYGMLLKSIKKDMERKIKISKKEEKLK